MMLLSTIFEIYRGSQRRKPEYLEKNNNIGFDFWCFNATFSNIMATSFNGGRSQSIRREPSIMFKQLVTCSCESSAPFLQFTKPGVNSHRIGDRFV